MKKYVVYYSFTGYLNDVVYMNENVDDHDKISDEFFDNHSERDYAECGNWDDPIITDIVEDELEQWEIDEYCEDEEDDDINLDSKP